MALEQSIDRLSALIEQLIAQLEAGRSGGAEAPKPAPTQPAKTTPAAPVAVAQESPSEGKSSSGATKPLASTAPADTGESTGAPAELDYEKDIMPLVARAIAENHRDEVVAMIQHFKPGAKKLSEALTREQYPNALSHIRKILGD